MKMLIFPKLSAVMLSTICLLSISFPMPAGAAGTSGGLLLITADTARNIALGGAGGALVDDPGVVFYNPAGLYSVERINLLFTHQNGLALDYSENINLVFPITPMGVVGVSLVYHGMAPLDDAGGGLPAIDVKDTLAIVSLGRSGSEFLAGFSYGLNLKFLDSVLGEYSTWAFAADMGVMWEPTGQARFGLCVKNLGTPMKFIDEADPLPLRFVLSGKYCFLSGSPGDFFVALDVEQTREADTIIHLGSEFAYAKTFFGRIGYVIAPGETKGISLGIGVQTPMAASRLRFDYAYRVTTWSQDSFVGTQLFTVGLIY